MTIEDSAKKISVIIPCFNAGSDIRRCVGSIIETGHEPLEIVIVDDASTDDTPAILQELACAHAEMLTVVRHSANGGPGKARNTGARVATGFCYLFIDSDTRMRPDTISLIAARIQEADAAYGHYHWEPLNNGPAARYKAFLNYHMKTRHGVYRYEVVEAAIAGIKAEVFDAVDGFDERIVWGMDYEGEDLGHRLFDRYQTLFDPEIMVHHKFPSFGRLTETYFNRVSTWMELFVRRRQFEHGGIAVKGTGLATAAFPAALLLGVLAVWVPAAAIGSLLLLLVYVRAYAGFFRFVLAKRPLFLPTAVAFNMYFCAVISAGATFGLLRGMTATGRVQS